MANLSHHAFIGSDESSHHHYPVRHTGDRDGKETVQPYIGDDKASVLTSTERASKGLR